MNFLKGKVKTKSIDERSVDALSSMTTLVKELEDINKDAKVIQDVNDQIIADRRAENDGLEKRIQNNAVVVSNIMKFLGQDLKQDV